MAEVLFELKDVAYQAPDGYQVIERANFTIDDGDAVLITGPSGSGKSTLLKLLANMISATEGEILYQGKSVYEYPPTEYRKEVSYFFQNPLLFDQTVRDNLAFPYEIRKESFDETAAIAALEKVKLSKDFLDKSIGDLSGGEKQRVAFVRNLLITPKVLLLDEVTASLDKTNREVIQQLLQELRDKEQVTIVMVSHISEDLTDFNRTIEIEEKVAGEINADER
ncbi:spermidine/putrescine ABC transporter ATP-binding protein [Suicoccus acidiformans]|uniref:Spermidine/putrescine ABC transporter ATP-binding protein n=1 Tax=Suicoccus acidiformans TaxID=2036206 RepID=A0A347WJV9_9LACT|nr:ATP-binding cassette domain-containing protein [Suicoccus acidiformans]AXY25366.1 spermidine/putrescine ABC transporter ATP-binding protein [Suicoccus acidiformans]